MGFGPKTWCTKNGLTRFFLLQISFFPTMVTLVWGGGEGVLGEGSPPPWFLIILKKPWQQPWPGHGAWVDRTWDWGGLNAGLDWSGPELGHQIESCADSGVSKRPNEGKRSVCSTCGLTPSFQQGARTPAFHAPQLPFPLHHKRPLCTHMGP